MTQAFHNAVRLLFLADTHLGLDAPLRPRVQRRRRGADFMANYLKALTPALQQEVDLLLHGGDMFFRSRVPPAIVAQAFEPLLHIADLGIPVFLVPGNHERSNIPRSLLETHSGIIVFDRPLTRVVTLNGCKIALTGFPHVRRNPRLQFKDQLVRTGWQSAAADIRLLCMHQAVEGAQVGVQHFTFRSGEEVIRSVDIPPGFDAVLSGHIHRHQVITKDLAGRTLRAPVFYPGSTERTSFAERDEEKGYSILTLAREPERRITHRFITLPTRPMIDLVLDIRGLSIAEVRERLIRRIASLDENAIVRIRMEEEIAPALLHEFNDRWLRSTAPPTMNISWGFHRRRTDEDMTQTQGRNDRYRLNTAKRIRDTRHLDNPAGR
ncbi:MAG TPA: DNA repair exonuclease [bacterium]|nr:DNA repair exonuclease [bacterium]